MPENPEFAHYVQQLANDLLVWIGFGTIVGLLAKAAMPGRDPGGPVATVAMGIGGTVIGCGVVSYFYEGPRITPISAIGLFVATLGAFVILFFYRLLGGYIIDESQDPRRRIRSSRSSRRQRRVEALRFDE